MRVAREYDGVADLLVVQMVEDSFAVSTVAVPRVLVCPTVCLALCSYYVVILTTSTEVGEGEEDEIKSVLRRILNGVDAYIRSR